MDRNLAARPEGALAGLMGALMALHNAEMTRYGVSRTPVSPGDRILDLGFGPGYSTELLARRLSGGLIVGADLSLDMARAARRRLAGARIRAGLTAASVSALPFADASFTTVFASNTVQFWPHLPADLREVRRVLRPGGLLVLCVRRRSRLHGVGYREEDVKELARAVSQAGFSDPGIAAGNAAAVVTAGR